MSNLLPQTEKETIRREYRIRLAIVALWLLFAAVSIASALLIPSYFLSSQKEKAASERFETLSANVRKENAAAIDSILSGAQSRLSLLSRIPPKVFFHEALTQVVSVKGSKISVEEISFTEGEDGTWKFIIRGRAGNRSALLSYAKALERAGIFKKADVPISDFAKDTDIAFSLLATSAW
ncbi:MAG: hypothetical protein AAB767_05185 [Patescibacteria group bacterium]